MALQPSGQSAAMMLAVRPCAPIEASKGGFLDIESIHHGDDIDGDRGRLTVTERLAGEKPCRSVAV